MLERGLELDRLNRALADAARGRGCVALITGEAGIGKTRLTSEFLSSAAKSARTLWGACDDLDTPRVLGPIRDIARQVGGDLEAQLSTSSQKAEIFGAAAQALDVRTSPTVAVIEDAHWADAATVDVLKYLGRRIRQLRLVLVVTYRDEELAVGHPLRAALGDLPPDGVLRLPLSPLSEAAVAAMAGSVNRSGTEVFAVTNGNPFLTTELLVSPGAAVPGNVFDALASRVARLEPSAREVVELAAVVPGRCERLLLKTVATDLDAALESGWAATLLEHDEGAVWFRHELARRAVEESLSPSQRRRLNQMITDELIEMGADSARIVHHAERAGDVGRIVEFAPAAARTARSVSAHREAAAHFASALSHRNRLDGEAQLDLLAEYTPECYYIDDQPAALEAAEQAFALAHELGDTRREGEMLRWMSRIRWWLGDTHRAREDAQRAIATLEAIPASHELAMAYSNMSQIHMLAHETKPAIQWASKAITTGREVGNHAAHAHALNNLGSAMVRGGDPEGLDLLMESLRLSLRERLDEHAARAYANSIWVCLDRRRYETAQRLLDEGLAFAVERELRGDEHYMTAERAWLLFDQGQWADAERDARWVLSRPQAPGITTLPGLIILARVQVRRGDGEAAATLDEAWAMAAATGELQRIAPASFARAEAAWLRGDVPGIRSAIAPAWDLIDPNVEAWLRDEAASWKSRAGDLDPGYRMTAEPYSLGASGDWAGAAEAWGALGCPYERAVALLESPEPEPLLDALDAFYTLGAVPAAALARARLRDLGVTAIPRGPRPATMTHRGGLTNRQTEVLGLLSGGLTNAEIAERLFISQKTVDHHVSAILRKLGVASRRAAVRWAKEIEDPYPR
jgi:DNA-binding CsgD family transcriptional regulator/tetratricopeptide (TPR) repeat protein